MSSASISVPRTSSKRVVCVSWDANLAATRELLLKEAGCQVTSIVGMEYAKKLTTIDKTDLLVLAHSIPRQQKQHILAIFRSSNFAPILSLLGPNQTKLPDADFAVEATSPADFVRVVREILAGERTLASKEWCSICKTAITEQQKISCVVLDNGTLVHASCWANTVGEED